MSDHAQTRGHHSVISTKLEFGNVEVHPEQRELLVGGAHAKLGARAFDVLLALIERRHRVVSKNELLDIVWPGLVVEENNLQVHISALRKALGAQAIATVPGRGYRFTLSARPADEPGRIPPAAAAPKPGIRAGSLLPLFGRDDDLRALLALVSSHRLVTVTGPGGIGKTALARALVQVKPTMFEDGIFLVELAAVSDTSLVATVVAGALAIELGNQPAADAIAQALSTSRRLVVLDNCEHLLQPVAALVNALLPLAPDVHWLATSQEPLKIAGEQVLRLDALSLPAAETLDAAASAGAIALFEARAKAADPRFVLDAKNVEAVVGICRDLDGIALAIELAAARVSVLGVDGLRRRLGERLRVLTGGARLALPRHQTLRAALEWSHSLLTPGQQVVFRRLGVFAGSFSLDAAQHVAADADIDRWAVLDDLSALIDKSLVVVLPDATAEPRYRLLETMRQFALDRLAAAGDGDAARTRHLEEFVALADQARVELLGKNQVAWTNRLGLEQENVLAAHAWCDQVPSGGVLGLRLVTGLNRYWLNRALFLLSYQTTIEALQRAGSERRDHLRCAALIQAGAMASRLVLRDEAAAVLGEAQQIAREIGDKEMLARALTMSGNEYHKKGEWALAQQTLAEALTLARGIGGDSVIIRSVATSLGELARTRGDWEAAQPFYEEALDNARRHGDLRGIGTSLINLSMLAINRGDVEHARTLVAESIAASEVTAGYGWMFTLLLCSGLAALKEEWATSARFEAAAVCHFARLGWVLDPADQSFADSVRARARKALGDEAFAAAQASALALTFDQTLVELRQWMRETL